MLLGLFKFIFWFFLITYLIKIIFRILAPFLIKRFADKMQSRFYQRNHNYQDLHKEDGKVSLKRTNHSKKSKSEGLGEYVDFEEIDE